MSDLVKRFQEYAAQTKLDALPYASEAEPGADVAETLAQEFARLTPLDVIGWESNLSDPIYRVVALDFMRSDRKEDTTVWDGRSLEEPVLIEGDLLVRGNLENKSNLTVLGDVTVEGGYVALGEYPCCSVAGDMTVRNLYANEAETLCLGTLRVKEALVVVYNHTVTITRRTEAETVIQSDAAIDGPTPRSRHHVDPSYGVFKEVFGIEFDDDADDFDPDEHIYDEVIDKVLG